MRGFDFFRRGTDEYTPRTPRGAMRGLEAEILPVEAYIASATSVRSLVEEPYNLDELERLLARENLDVDTNVILVRIFERLVKSHDAEVALFAAESINLIENRYNTRIEQARSALEEGGLDHQGRGEALRTLARLYRELAQLYEHAGSIRRFYLREAHGALGRLREMGPLEPNQIELLVDILLDLNIPEQAAAVIQAHAPERSTFSLLLQARVEFSRANYLRVLEICSWLVQAEDELTQNERELVAFWLGRQASP